VKSRRVHRVRTAQKQAREVLDTYRNSHRGLQRVFTAIVAEDDGPGAAASALAAHHLAEIEALLPRLREAIRSCRYPGAENGDPAALLWGLWGQLSESSLHMKGAVAALETLGRLRKYRSGRSSGGAETRSESGARKSRKKVAKSAKRPPAKPRAGRKGAPSKSKSPGKRSDVRAKTGPKSGKKRKAGPKSDR